MMLRPLALTVRIHRTEIAIIASVLLVTAVAIVLVTLRLMGTGGLACLNVDDAGCQTAIDNFYRIRDGEASYLRGAGAGLLPVLAGLVLGVPLVGRELELRTASFAWSLSPNRARWLRQRVVPMLLLLLLALGCVGLLEVVLGNAANPAGVRRLDDIAAQGIPFAAVGVMAFGIATLAGAVVGRTLPAFLIAGFLAVALALPGSAALSAVLANQQAVWREASADAGPALLQLREAYRTSQGGFETWEQILAWFEAQPEGTDWDTWESANVTRMELVVPADRYPVFEWAQTASAVLIGVAALLLTFPLVRRRRPR